MFIYYLYGYKFYSNIEIINAPQFDGQLYFDTLRLIYTETSSGCNYFGIDVKLEKEYCSIAFGDGTKYEIDSVSGTIQAFATDAQIIESTILNLPFAILAAMRNSLLLHASAIISNNFVMPIFAPKGTGKSTLTAKLSEHIEYFSDDTVYATLNDNKIIAYYGSQIIKLYKDSSDALGLKRFSDKTNIQGKCYFCPSKVVKNASEAYNLHSLFFLTRSEEKHKLIIDKINSKNIKSIYLHSNICGIDALGYEYNKMIDGIPLFNKILNLDFYKITIPSGFHNLQSSCKEFCEFINHIAVKTINFS